MKIVKTIQRITLGSVVAASALLTGCNQSFTQPDQPVGAVVENCGMPTTLLLGEAMNQVREQLGSGCVAQFDAYFDYLLEVGAGDPRPENATAFSEFLVWASDKGIISKLQAKKTFTRYFGIKFVSAMGDYNTCSQTCPVKKKVLNDMQHELADKERGLRQVAGDMSRYKQADALYQKMELMITATCEACTPTVAAY